VTLTQFYDTTILTFNKLLGKNLYKLLGKNLFQRYLSKSISGNIFELLTLFDSISLSYLHKIVLHESVIELVYSEG